MEIGELENLFEKFFKMNYEKNTIAHEKPHEVIIQMSNSDHGMLMKIILLKR